MGEEGYDYDAVVIGSGPNGFAAAITLARKGARVLILEGKNTIGGGMRSENATLPGFVHDVCSTTHPLASSSPFFASIPLEKYGLSWVYSDVSCAHPLDHGDAVLAYLSLEKTCEQFGKHGDRYKKWMAPLLNHLQELFEDILAPIGIPKNPLIMMRFVARALPSADVVGRFFFQDPRLRAFFAGMAAHSVLPLTNLLTSAVGTMLSVTCHGTGWPIAKGGSGNIALALERYFLSLGGQIQTGFWVKDLQDLPNAKHYIWNTAPKHMSAVCSEKLPNKYRKKIQKYRYGPAAFKLDFALSEPIPWANKDISKAPSFHLGGSAEEITQSEKDCWQNKISDNPYMLGGQQSLFDNSRAPKGKHTAWAYCHVPNGCVQDRSEVMIKQIERFAPGFRDCILAKKPTSPKEMEAYNPNYIGGDIIGGVQDLVQAFARPVLRKNPYATPLKNHWLCSASTPPGGGVHGMAGYHCSQSILNDSL
jgi:phytoene dehydrogenase-like protein